MRSAAALHLAPLEADEFESEERPMRDVLTVDETAEYLGVAASTVRSGIRCGDLHAVRLGRRILIPRAALLRFLYEPDTDGHTFGRGEFSNV